MRIPLDLTLMNVGLRIVMAAIAAAFSAALLCMRAANAGFAAFLRADEICNNTGGDGQ